MIDWLTIRFPCHAAGDFGTDTVRKFDMHGRELFVSRCRVAVPGSYSEVVSLRPVELRDNLLRSSELKSARCSPGLGAKRARRVLDGRSFYQGAGFEISGCPLKFLQGHNCFGDDDLRGYALAMIAEAMSLVGVELWPEEWAELESGKFVVLRADITQMRGLSSPAAVNAVIRAAEYGAALRRRGHGQLYKGGESILFGAGSRRWSVTMYAKLLEMQKHRGKRLSEDDFGKLCEYSRSALRIEVRLHRLELADKGLDFGFAWQADTAARLYNEYIAAINLAGEVVMNESVVSQLPIRLRGVYDAWQSGADLRGTMKKPTFYRNRAALLKFGIDIAVKVPKSAASNVVPLRSVFEAVPLGVPEWARGTPLYFDLSDSKRRA